MISIADIVVRDDEPIAATVDDEVVILSAKAEAYFGLGETGSKIWKMLATPHLVSDICAELVREYDVELQVCERDTLDFLTKPVREKDLLEAIQRAQTRDAELRQLRSELDSIQAKINTLTPREREVFTHVVAGRLNKQIAGDLGTVEKTIKVHRSRMMEKLGLRSVADLVRMAEKAQISK